MAGRSDLNLWLAEWPVPPRGENGFLSAHELLDLAEPTTDQTEPGAGEQLLRGVLVATILLATPFLVLHFLLPIVLAHPLGIVVAVLLLALLGTGLYTIAEGRLPSFFQR